MWGGGGGGGVSRGAEMWGRGLGGGEGGLTLCPPRAKAAMGRAVKAIDEEKSVGQRPTLVWLDMHLWGWSHT